MVEIFIVESNVIQIAYFILTERGGEGIHIQVINKNKNGPKSNNQREKKKEKKVYKCYRGFGLYM